MFDSLGSRVPGRNVLFLLALLACSYSDTLRAQGQSAKPAGIAWRVIGSWLVAGTRTPILNGGFIQPGSLLTAGSGNSAHSLTILLPDGQRILYECFSSEDCARGFRVPQLCRQPDPLATEMMTAIHPVLFHWNRNGQLRTDSRVSRDEVIATLDPRNQVEVAGLVAALPDGRYSYNLYPLDQSSVRQARVPFEKNSSSIKLTLPSPGLYEVTIADQLGTLRINLLVAALKSGEGANYIKLFHNAKALLHDWNDDYQGWPIHDLQRAYLEALMLHSNLSAESNEPAAVIDHTLSNVTAEPVFLPSPGVFAKDMAVTLRCETADSTIHYTVDGSQPFKTSPVYHAPIIVKGTALTIKAYSTAQGKKDSPVVTGIFRIEEEKSR